MTAKRPASAKDLFQVIAAGGQFGMRAGVDGCGRAGTAFTGFTVNFGSHFLCAGGISLGETVESGHYDHQAKKSEGGAFHFAGVRSVHILS